MGFIVDQITHVSQFLPILMQPIQNTNLRNISTHLCHKCEDPNAVEMVNRRCYVLNPKMSIPLQALSGISCIGAQFIIHRE